MTVTEILKEEEFVENVLNDYLHNDTTRSFVIGELIQHVSEKILETNADIESDISLIVKSVIWSLVDAGKVQFTNTRKIQAV